jgi:hypothetical protein
MSLAAPYHLPCTTPGLTMAYIELKKALEVKIPGNTNPLLVMDELKTFFHKFAQSVSTMQLSHSLETLS